MKRSLFAIILIAVVFALLVFVNKKVHAPKQVPNVTPATIEESARLSFAGHAAEKGITDLSLKPNDGFVSGKITVTGKAQGYMFEGSFPVKVVTPTGAVLWQGPATMTTNNWMTTDPVPFSFVLDTTKLANGQVSIILSQDDPSGGEAGPVKSLEIPITIKN